jgi:hypothetical protein
MKSDEIDEKEFSFKMKYLIKEIFLDETTSDFIKISKRNMEWKEK